MGLPTHVLDWFHGRGITDEVLAAARIGWDGSRIVIPITRPDGSTFNKYRRDPASETGDKYGTDPGGKRTLYNHELLPYSDTVLIVEGELDALRLVSARVVAVSSTAGAASWDASWSPLFAGKVVIIWYDADEAGHRGAARTAAHIQPHAKETWLASHDPARGKDLTEVLRGTDFSLDRLRDFVTLAPHIQDSSAPSPFKPTGPVPDLLPVLERYGLVPRREESVLPCPFHEDKTASMSVSLGKGLFHCFACGAAGTAIHFIMRKENITYAEARKRLRA